MIKVAICDDKMGFRKNIVQACHQYFTERQLECEIMEYDSGEAFLMGEHPDILLLDIKMHRIDGFMVRDVLAGMRAETRIVFVSENRNFISEAFGRNVFGYLIKPIRYQAFCDKMDEIVEDVQQSEQFVYCKKGNEIEKVYFRGILYLESYGRYTKIYVQGDNEGMLSERGILKWCDVLPKEQFVRCNRLQVVNLRQVAKVQEDIALINGTHILISPRLKKNFWMRYEQLGGR